MILITGATGFVGRHVLQSLLDSGHDVRLVLREGSRTFNSEKVDDIFYTDDLFNESLAWWKKVCEGVDTVVHLAWYVDHSNYLQSPKNLDCLVGTLNLARGAAAAGVSRFVGIGTCFEYDLSVGVLSIDTPLKPSTLYASSKVATFLNLSEYFSIEGIDFSWCRLFYLYGDGEDARRLVPYIRKKLEAEESVDLTLGEQIRDFLEVKVAADEIVQVILGKAVGAVNICSGKPITVRQLAEKIADEYGKRELLRFGARQANLVDPPCVVGVKTKI